MRTLVLLAFAIVSAAAVLMAADDRSVTGKWKLHQDIADNESDQVCTFTQKGNELAGSCVGTNGPVNITGKVEDKKVSWVYKSEYNGGPITLTYKGVLGSSGKMEGTVTVEEYGADGDFTASRAQ